MNLQPTGTNIVILPAKTENKTKEGLIITDETVNLTPIAEATVIAVGPDVKQPIKVDDRVLYERFSAATVTLGEETHYFIQEANLKAIVR